ncbi:type 1 periplasmic-binding domain-containing protein [Subtercola endophyticus]|uniref:hypothetical protein n=1 Tax=Subtercola endophyticus TaxID=2895559 RepID=UPI001E4C10EC|nr:hypothetical protein [Subtercola endophyticus]UFS58118.1 hypothetical protein LQ955_13990 [Subtercola endophyticus]
MARSTRARMTLTMLAALTVASVATGLVGCSSGSGSSSSSGSAAPADLAAAQTSVDAALKAPTAITQTVPLPKAPEHGLVIDVDNGLPGSLRIGAGVQAAAEAAGWEFQSISFDASSPASLQAALMNALAKNPTFVTEAGTPQSQFGDSVLAAYKAAGVGIIVNSAEPVVADAPIVADSTEIPNGYALNKAMGKILADWFIVDSKGTGNAIIASVSSFPSLKGLPDGFIPEVQALCPGCTVNVTDISLADIQAGTNQDTAVAALRRSPNTGYLFFDNGQFAVGIDSKLAAAGLTNVKVAGIAPEPKDISDLAAGGTSAWTTIGFEYTGYASMDLAFRKQQGVDLTTNNAVQPVQLVTSANASTVTVPWNLPTDALAQFSKLWQIK